MKNLNNLMFLISILFSSLASINAQKQRNHFTVFKNGAVQIVPKFEYADKWTRHDLWVEIEFNTNGDGKLDRMPSTVKRPFQTELEFYRKGKSTIISNSHIIPYVPKNYIGDHSISLGAGSSQKASNVEGDGTGRGKKPKQIVIK